MPPHIDMWDFNIKSCNLCPRECGQDRTLAPGLCGEGAEMRVSKIMLHKWEEPCISGSDSAKGSGAIFFSGCPLHCIYCQNRDISRGGKGKIYSPSELSLEIQKLEEAGAYNINFVTPTHFLHRISDTLSLYRPKVPTVFNMGGYEKVSSLSLIRPYADIFLLDIKYAFSENAQRYSNCPDYPEVSIKALKAMVDMVGKPLFGEDGMLLKGVILRHLILPGGRHESKEVLRRVNDSVGAENVILSLMSQYTPDFAPKDEKPLNRRITAFEYNDVLSFADSLGFTGYSQERDSATKAYTPDF